VTGALSLDLLGEVENNPDILEYLRRLVRDDPGRIKDHIRFDEASGDFVVTLWDRHPEDQAGIRVTQQDVELGMEYWARVHGDEHDPRAPLWPQILKIAYAKSHALRGRDTP
jgi:hypothetical protein